MRSNTPSGIFLLMGLVCIAAALFMTGYNLATQNDAGTASEQIVQELSIMIPQQETTPVQSQAVPQAPRPEVAPVYIMKPTPLTPDYELNPEMPMPATEVDGTKYIGILSIPDLGLLLPVATTWTYELLRKTPCRYYGSVYTDDLVIAAHNYAQHFGNLNRLRYGNTVTFLDTDGNLFSFEVRDVEIIEPTDIDGMIHTDYDLSLFTCTVGGQARVAVRCEKVED